MKNVPLFKKINRCVSEANEELSMKKLLKKTLKLILPIVLGGFILFWVYHNFDFTKVGEVLLHGTNWWWMFFRYYSGCSHSVSRLAVEADVGAVGSFPEKE